MKKILKRILLILAFFLFALYLLTPTGEERLIRKALSELVELSEISGTEHPFVRIKIAKQLSAYASSKSSIEFKAKDNEYEPIVFKDQRELEQKIIIARAQLKLLKIVIQNVKIKLRENTANVELVINAYGKFSNEEGDFFDRHRIELELIRESAAENWKVATARHLENLRGEAKE